MKASKKIIFRLLALGIPAFLAWISIAYIAPQISEGEAYLEKGKYRIASLEDGHESFFQGPVYFEFAERHYGFKDNPVFKLHFINDDSKTCRGFGFVIPLPGDGKSIAQESYEVTSRSKRFHPKFESVFGYADLINDDSRPFFTESGSISISHATEWEVSGEMNMLLSDARGNSIKLVGRFNALPLRNLVSL